MSWDGGLGQLGLLGLSTRDIQGQIILHCGGTVLCLVGCIAAPLDSAQEVQLHPFASHDNHVCLQMLTDVPEGGEGGDTIALVENYQVPGTGEPSA